MALAFSGLSAYTKQLVKPLLQSAIFDAKTQGLIKSKGNIITGVKSSVALPQMDTDAVFGTQSCSFDASGTTTFSQRTLTVGKIKVEEKICPKDFEQYFLQEALRAGSTYEDFGNADFQAAYLDRKNKRIAAQLETALWQGDTASATANLNKFDGLQKLIAAGSPINANVSGYTGIAPITTLTASNVIAAIKGVKNAIPAALKGKTDVVIMCGYDVYDLYVDAGVAANYFTYSFGDNSNYGGLKVPGTGITLEAVHGLDGTGDIYAMQLSNVFLGVDIEGEEMNYKLWFSEDNNDIRFRAEWKAGVQVGYTTQVVSLLAAI